MVDFPGPVSLIHAGLDAWPFDEKQADHREFRIDDEPRLARRLGVDFFVQPPDFRTANQHNVAVLNAYMKLPFLRFPLWHVCPRCGRMHKARYQDIAPPICSGPIATGKDKGQRHQPRKTFQVRFVAACTKGHIQDFPWVEWIFEGNSGGWTTEGNVRWLRMNSSGSASLAGISVQAEEATQNGEPKIVARKSLGSALYVTDTETALSRIGLECTGINPVLAIGTELRPAPGCGEPLHTLLKSSANLYFPTVVSSIYIPDIEDEGLTQDLLDLLDDRDIKSQLREIALVSDTGLVSPNAARNALKKYHPESGVNPKDLAEAANRHLLHGILLENRLTRAFLEQRIKTDPNHELSLESVTNAIKLSNEHWEIDPAVLLGPLKSHFSAEEPDPAESVRDETDFRQQEYRIFSRDIQVGVPKTDLDIRSAEMGKYDSFMTETFSRIALLHRLRETRAFDGFSRIYAGGLTTEERRGLFMANPKNWLPAIVVRGEGIFLQFSEERLSQWIKNKEDTLNQRLAPMKSNMEALADRRHQDPRLISPRFVMLHTFAHLVINQLVQDCGYGSASLRERIYSSDDLQNPMAGVLIYTAAGDSEGSMGGLVRMGQPDRLGEVIQRALSKAGWCSTDPVCIESIGQGPDNCNLAACHSCALLPETSCEEQNRLLDRGVVVGTINKPDIGFFSCTN